MRGHQGVVGRASKADQQSLYIFHHLPSPLDLPWDGPAIRWFRANRKRTRAGSAIAENERVGVWDEYLAQVHTFHRF